MLIHSILLLEMLLIREIPIMPTSNTCCKRLMKFIISKKASKILAWILEMERIIKPVLAGCKVQRLCFLTWVWGLHNVVKRMVWIMHSRIHS